MYKRQGTARGREHPLAQTQGVLSLPIRVKASFLAAFAEVLLYGVCLLYTSILPSLDLLSDVPQDEIDNVEDDLESVEEQLTSAAPKKKRLQKAVDGIKKFLSDFSMKVAS